MFCVPQTKDQIYNSTNKPYGFIGDNVEYTCSGCVLTCVLYSYTCMAHYYTCAVSKYTCVGYKKPSAVDGITCVSF